MDDEVLSGEGWWKRRLYMGKRSTSQKKLYPTDWESSFSKTMRARH